MPFTFAHPAAVLPIRAKWKQWLSLAPLVIGSIVPDGAYYLPLPSDYKESAHSWLGTTTFSIPVGLAILLIFYWMAPEIDFLLPNPHRDALQPISRAPKFSLRNGLLAILGIAIGAESHIAWDSFTHTDGWVVRHVPSLHILWGTHPYFILQIASSVLGVWFLFYVYDRWAIREGFRAWTWRDSYWRAWLWIAILTISFVPAVIESRTIHAITSLSFLYGRHFLVVLITSFIRNLLLALCAAVLWAKLSGRRTRLDVAY